MPSHEPQPPIKRPAIGGRNASTPSLSKVGQPVQSPSATPPPLTSYKQSGHKMQKQHTVGRAHAARNPSYGKNINKLPRIASAQPDELHMTSKPNRWSHSRTPSASPQEQPIKKGGSQVSLPRNRSNVSLKKNLSNVSLKKRNGLKTETARLAKQENPSRQSKQQNGRARPHTATVHFEVGNEEEDENEGPDEEWTEASRSQSPIATRNGSTGPESNIRSHTPPPRKPQTPQSSNPPSPAESPNRTKRQQPNRSASSTVNGLQLQQSSTRNLDADVITSRLLQRRPQNNAPPKMSTVSATATPGNHSPRSYGQSQESTLNGTLGLREDGVSRFIGENLSDTPGDSSSMSARAHKDENRSRIQANGSQKRNKSMGNISSQPEQDDQGASSPTKAKKPPSSPYHQAPPSRTQQKLWLQRASSNIEPQQLMPASGVNGGLRPGTTSLGGLGSGYGDGRDPRLQRQFEQTGQEYLVVRRYRNPVGDAIARYTELPGSEKNRRIPPSTSKVYLDGGDGRMGLSQSLKESRNREMAGSSDSSGAIASLEGARGSKDDSGVGSDRGDRDRQAIEEILRRIWDRVDQPVGD
ncbi:MAG: hypothetical protein M1836_008055 [Candelina mexicana]|nr:MAG: hypothetical protein M1836_008055 [Candelina mexicana]